jgi:hypothetical protein
VIAYNEVMALTLTIKNEHELHTVAKPNYRENLSAFMPAFFFPLWILFVSKNVSIPFFLYGIYVCLVKPRERQCVVDLEKQTIYCCQNGILNSPIDKIEKTLDRAEISSISMVRAFRQNRGTYCAIELVVKNHSQAVTIINSDLSFRDCQFFCCQIQEFLGPEIPIVAVGSV